jgi:serine/threonine-protein kinase
MGEVWSAVDERLAAPCAVKFLQESTDVNSVERFMREAQAAAQIRSPHVVTVLDHGSSAGRPYIAMELLEGEDLAARLRRLGQLQLGEAARVVQHVARALTRAHAAGVVHRDLKPANIFVLEDDDGLVFKVVDFGIAKRFVDPRALAPLSQGEASSGATLAGQTLGTPAYMSPEHVNGEATDQRTDLWALAVVAYECLTGVLPFPAANLGALVSEITTATPVRATSIRPELSPSVDAWFERSLAKSRERRYQTAKELADAFADAMSPSSAPTRGADPVAAPVPDNLPFAPTQALLIPPPRTGRSRRLAIGAAMLVGVGALATALALRHGDAASNWSVGSRYRDGWRVHASRRRTRRRRPRSRGAACLCPLAR